MVLAFFALFPSVSLAYNEKLWGLLFVDVLMFVVALGMIFIRPLKYEIRAGAALLITYVLGVFLIWKVGFISGGPAWLFSFVVIAGLLLGLKAAIFALVLNAATMIAIVMIFKGANEDLLLPFTSELRAWAAFGSFILWQWMSNCSLHPGFQISAVQRCI